mmetsp:Transcript_14913/g.22980  ORF Transcript_14913/g.22980 Transcript_14913/m.22980 type:complete len:288 (+) Transcript_14913:57-920(+)
MKLSIALLLTAGSATAFAPSSLVHSSYSRHLNLATKSDFCKHSALCMSAAEANVAESAAIADKDTDTNATSEFPPILQELREVAMRLHTREQAPREGKAEEPKKPAEPYVPTQADYLQFLVDSYVVYVALEEIVNEVDALAPFRNSGLERTQALETDIAYMCERFDLQRPDAGKAGSMYAAQLKNMIKSDEDVPEFMCHYYNFYFAHLAGGRMIGKQMSKLLLDGEALEFYKWGENVNGLKDTVKGQIEELAKGWNRQERDSCIDATAAAFMGGGGINGYLYGRNPH